MIMKSNYQATPIEHLENRQPKCKMHIQERQLTRFFCILQLIYKENQTESAVFLKKRIELEKSILHIPNMNPGW